MTQLIKSITFESTKDHNFRVSTGVDTLELNDTAKTLIPDGTITTSLTINTTISVDCFYVSSVEGGNFTVIAGAGVTLTNPLGENVSNISFTGGEFVLFQQQSTDTWEYKILGEGNSFMPIYFSVDSSSTTAAHATFTGEIEIDGTSEVKDSNISSVDWYYRDSTTSGAFVKAGTLTQLSTYITSNIGPTDDISIRPLAIYSGSGLGSVGFDYKLLYR